MLNEVLAVAFVANKCKLEDKGSRCAIQMHVKPLRPISPQMVVHPQWSMIFRADPEHLVPPLGIKKLVVEPILRPSGSMV